MSDLSNLSEAELYKMEQAIARKHIGKFPWGSLLWAISNTAIWFSLFPLVLLGIMPLWIAFPIAIINISLSYLPSHEAQHGIFAKPGTRWYWLNEAVGHISLIPLVLPYRIARATHMEHHKHANDPELDPDYDIHAPNGWQAMYNTWRQFQTGNERYSECLTRIGQDNLKVDALIANIYFYGTLTIMAWLGYAIEAALLWWLPRQIALIWIQFYLSWMPHHPGKDTGRYKDTRAFKSRAGNLLSGGMQYHIIHHLHPRIPLLRTGRAYWEMIDILEARGCDLGDLKRQP